MNNTNNNNIINKFEPFFRYLCSVWYVKQVTMNSLHAYDIRTLCVAYDLLPHPLEWDLLSPPS